ILALLALATAALGAACPRPRPWAATFSDDENESLNQHRCSSFPLSAAHGRLKVNDPALKGPPRIRHQKENMEEHASWNHFKSTSSSRRSNLPGEHRVGGVRGTADPAPLKTSIKNALNEQAGQDKLSDLIEASAGRPRSRFSVSAVQDSVNT
uniref:Secreted protein n=1 Tax=Macrostomum lignano TaxID=282301 RepID=A0A1I8FDV4_9PLAT